jgi:hypothetical protein
MYTDAREYPHLHENSRTRARLEAYTYINADAAIYANTHCLRDYRKLGSLAINNRMQHRYSKVVLQQRNEHVQDV